MKARPALSLLLPALLAACSVVGPGSGGGITIHAPLLRTSPLPEGLPATVAWQLVVTPPTGGPLVDSPRIAVRPQPGELQAYRGAAWSMPATDLVEAGVLQVLEDSGRLPGVARSNTGVQGDYRLVLDVRRFEADYAGQSLPTATLEIHAKLVEGNSRQVVATRTFHQGVQATGTAVASVVPAFEQALSAICSEIGQWTLASGERHHAARRAPGS